MGKHAWIFSLIVITTAAITGFSPRSFAQGGDLPEETTRTSDYTCEISGAIALSSDSKHLDNQSLIGRGIASCRNSQGFSIDYPIMMKLTADTSLKDLLSNTGVRAVAEPFSVTRDPNEMFDTYQNYNMLHPKLAMALARTIQPVAVARGLASSRSIVLHGDKNKLFINMTLMGNPDALLELKIHSLSLIYDDEAPTLD